MNRFFGFTTQRPWLSLLFSLLISLPFLIALPGLRPAENIDLFTLEGDRDIEYYEEFKKVFGHDEFFVIAFSDENIFTESNLSLIRDLSSSLESIDDVRKVVSLATVDDTLGEEDYFLVQKFLHQIPSNSVDLEKLRNAAVHNPLYRGRLVSEDGSAAAIVVFVYERPEDENYRSRLMASIFNLLAQHEQADRTFHVAGDTILNLRLSENMKRDTAIFIPLVYLIVIGTIFIIFRDFRIVALSFINVSLCLACTMGFIAMAGSTLNNVTTIIPPLIMALSLADTVHVFSHYRSNRSKFTDTRRALMETVRELYKPCLMTTATTMVGFMSLRVSHLPLVKDFALISSVGVGLAFVFSFLFLPAAIVVCPPSQSGKCSSTLFDSVLEKFGMLHLRHGKTVLFVFSFIGLAALLSMSRIKVETDLMTFFRKDNPLRQSTEFIDTHLAGTIAIEASVVGKERDAFKEPIHLEFIDKVQSFMASLPEINTANSLADYMKDMNKSFHNEDKSFYRLPETRELIAQYLLLYDSDDIGDFVNPSFDHARIIARTDRHSSREQQIILKKIDDYLRKNTPGELEAKVTGGLIPGLKASHEMVRGQVASLSVAVFIISMMMFFIFRSFTLGLLSLVPNTFPILMNFGIMGLLGIPLNTATALISAVAIGIAVDDTIHFLYQYREERRENRKRAEAIQRTIRIKGQAIVTTSVILAAGFGVLLFSSFIPTVQFGALTSLIMVSALTGDLLLLPAILGLKLKFLP